ncbi:hypothetical protein H0H93_016956 [Arthromyces matolae]|nr:hypothetical protein H0H93_016956 [Arthromyces matolae]
MHIVVVIAQTSLYIPGFDPQPISADILGVDGQGRTTWAVHQGALTGTFDEVNFPGTATLVEGGNDAYLTYANSEFTMGMDCNLSGGIAICSATVSGEPVTETDTIAYITVQGGTTYTGAPAETSAPAASTGVSSASTPVSTPSGSAAQTSENTSSAPSPTQSSGASATLPSSLLGLLLSAAVLILY